MQCVNSMPANMRLRQNSSPKSYCKCIVALTAGSLVGATLATALHSSQLWSRTAGHDHTDQGRSEDDMPSKTG